MNPLRAMHVVLELSTGGLEKSLIDLLPRFCPEKIHSSVCCISDKGNMSNLLEVKGIKVHLVKKDKKNQFRFYKELKKLFIEEKIDIVHSYSGVYRDAIISSRLAGISINIHTDQGRFYPVDSIKARLNHRFFSFFRDKVVAVSNELKDFLTRDVGIDPKKVIVIHNAVDIAMYNTEIDIDKKKKELSIFPDEDVIGVVARLAPVKDHKTLFLSFQKVKRVLPRTKLLVVGEGPLEKELKLFAEELGEEKNIAFLGRREDVSELLQVMDIVSLSSINEGLSLTLAEAMASGKPIVATDVGGNSELVAGGVTGLLVPPKDINKMSEALILLLNSDKKRKEMGLAGKKRVKEMFNIQNSAKAYEELYLGLAEQKGLIQ